MVRQQNDRWVLRQASTAGVASDRLDVAASLRVANLVRRFGHGRMADHRYDAGAVVAQLEFGREASLLPSSLQLLGASAPLLVLDLSHPARPFVAAPPS